MRWRRQRRLIFIEDILIGKERTRNTSNSGRIATAFWGLFACIVAIYATNLGSLIEVVNKFGSFFLRFTARRFRFGIRRQTGKSAWRIFRFIVWHRVGLDCQFFILTSNFYGLTSSVV